MTSLTRHASSDLQRAFFPPAYRNTAPSSTPKPGQPRIFPAFRVLVEVDDDFVIHIPYREISKVNSILCLLELTVCGVTFQNWQWDGQTVTSPAGRKRTGAALSLKCTKRSALRYIVPIVADGTGYHASLDILLHAISVTSSTNDILFITATDIQVSCDECQLRVATDVKSRSLGDYTALLNGMACRPGILTLF